MCAVGLAKDGGGSSWVRTAVGQESGQGKTKILLNICLAGERIWRSRIHEDDVGDGTVAHRACELGDSRNARQR